MTMPPDLDFNQVVKIVNYSYVKLRPLQTRLFIILCSEMGIQHITRLNKMHEAQI